MTRAPGWRDAAASELAAHHAPFLELEGPALVMDDPADTLAEALGALGLEVRRWWRRAHGGRPASAWPRGDPCATVGVRLPRAKDQLDMMLHAAASVLVRDGRLLVFGAGDEGAGSAGRRMQAVFDDVRTVATGGRCRVLQARGLPPEERLRADLDAWCEWFDPGLDELPERWASFPGVFAHGRLDGGTALLADVLPAAPPSARALDFGCGHGVLGAVVAARTPGAEVAFLDVDAVALEAVRRNVPGARTALADGWAGAPNGAWDVVVSNPPYHRGKGESLGVVEELIRGARSRLAPGGWLALVAQRRLPVPGLLAEALENVDVLGDSGPWRAWWARSRT